MKSFSSANKILILALVLSASQAKAFFDQPLLIQSLESKTIQGDPVFNEITWFEFKDKDVWMMNQSHFGLNAKPEQKDRVVAIVDKTQKPYATYFLQVAPGPLIWSDELLNQRRPFKVSCFICHSNGLRAIRADANGYGLAFLDNARLNYFNYKIRSYGLMVEDSKHTEEDVNLKVPFRYRNGLENDVLQVKSCSACHDGKSRGFLRRQNAVTIQFLVENKLMPPKPEILKANDLKKIKNFLNGF